MIGRLQGMVIEKQPPEILLDVQGVGYELLLPMTSFYSLPEINEQVTLFTHLVVREDAHLLFGFATKQDRTLFRELIKTNGVGPKLALAILSAMQVDEFVFAIEREELSKLVKIPGVGKKTAERLIIEMRDRVGNGSASLNAIAGELVPVTPEHDAITALISLGYKAAEAERAVGRITLENASAEDLIRQALKGMVKA